jgi:hypothetical protein
MNRRRRVAVPSVRKALAKDESELGRLQPTALLFLDQTMLAIIAGQKMLWTESLNHIVPFQSSSSSTLPRTNIDIDISHIVRGQQPGDDELADQTAVLIVSIQSARPKWPTIKAHTSFIGLHPQPRLT